MSTSTDTENDLRSYELGQLLGKQNNNHKIRQLKQSLKSVFQVDCLAAMIYHIAASKMVKGRVTFLRRNEKFE